jgi:hypothetical protein
MTAEYHPRRNLIAILCPRMNKGRGVLEVESLASTAGEGMSASRKWKILH